MRQYLTFSIMFLVVLASATAIHLPSKEEMDSIVDYYNNNVDKIPKIALSLFGNERMNIYVDGDLIYGAVTKSGKITEINEKGIENPTLDVYTTGDTIKNIVNGKITIQEAIKNKDIDYKGVGFVKRTKFGLAKTIGKIFF
jgi:hypothetical protein